MIFVAVDYRQGFEGFLAMHDTDLPGNLGLEDILMALRFVRDNAYNFGGDPNNIVVAGDGTGAALAGILATSPKTNGLIQGVMLFSGTTTAPWAVQHERTKNNTIRVLWNCKCVSGSSKKLKECLKKADPSCYHEEIEKRDFFDYVDDVKTMYEAHRMGLSPFTPVIDSYRGWDAVLGGEPEEQVKQNARVRALFSNAAHERLFNCGKIAGLPIPLKEWVDGIVEARFGNSTYVKDLFDDWYHPLNPIHETDKARRTSRLLTFTEDDWVADTQHEALHYADKGQNVYTLLNNIYGHPNAGPDGKWGTDHGTDLAMLFDSRAFYAPFGQYNWEELSFGKAFADRLADVISEFVANGHLQSHPKFTRANWVVLRITFDRIEHKQFSAENYNFWREAAPELAKLQANEIRRKQRETQ
ncbi:unnamed protein product, partial [Mesorhabditis belari]